MAIINYDGISGISSITATGGTVRFYNSSGVTASITVGQLGLSQQTASQRNAGVATAIGTIIYNATSGFVEVYSPGGWSSIGGFQATGGTIDSTIRSGYRVHTFTSPGTFTVTNGLKSVEYLVVAGGAGGGGGELQNGAGGGAGGGGAGGMRTGIIDVSVNGGPTNNGTYTVTIGSGGGGGAAAPSPVVPTGGGRGSNGTDSVFGTITSTGGGGGAGDQGDFPGPNAGYGAQPGGSGGGRGGDDNNALTVATGIPGQGNPGSLLAASRSGGGGGGAGAAGSQRQGGIGLQSSINGTPTFYAGGGSGGAGGQNTTTVPGGSGGGGTGSSTDGTINGSVGGGTATAGGTNTGGGGGGGAAGRSQNGQSGGPGIVIISYPYQ
jgi:hypothetical protein